jgi:hypothetical protein
MYDKKATRYRWLLVFLYYYRILTLYECSPLHIIHAAHKPKKSRQCDGTTTLNSQFTPLLHNG